MSHPHKQTADTPQVIRDPATGHWIQGGKYAPRESRGVVFGGVSYTAHAAKAERFPDKNHADEFIKRHGLKDIEILPESEM